jgi:long-chain fatty acid transport protein
MKKINLLCATVTFLILTSISIDTFSTDGYFSNGIGTRSKGFAGAGISFIFSPFSAANNPGAIGFQTQDFRFAVGIGLFNPNRQYTITGEPTPSPLTFGLTPGTVESGSKYFPIPTLAFTFKLGEKNTLGLNIWGNGGMNTDYDAKTYYSQTTYDQFGGDANPMNPLRNVSVPTGVNITQIFSSLTYARVLGENHSIGVSPIFVYQTFEATGLEAFRDIGMAGSPLTPDWPDNSAFVTNNGSVSSTGFGFKIGYQGQLFDGFRLGVSVQPKIGMSKFDEYKGLFAEEGGFDIPLTWTAGVSYDINENFTLLFDVKQILYSDIKSIANEMIPQNMMPGGFAPDGTFIPNPDFVPLGDENGAGFGWEDMTIFKIGAEFRMVENWDFRLGYSHGGQPIGTDDVMFNILAPGLIEDHISIGATRYLGDHALHFAFTYALNHAVEGPNPFDPAQTIKIEMNQMEFELAFTF